MFWFNKAIISPSGSFNKASDYNFHYLKAQGDCPVEQFYCDRYPHNFHLIAGFYANEEPFFVLFVLFALCFIIPLLLFYLKKSFWIVWFYFTATNFVYFFYSQGYFPQLFAVIPILLILLFRKHPILQLICVFAVLNLHGYSFWFALTVFIATLIFDYREQLSLILCSVVPEQLIEAGKNTLTWQITWGQFTDLFIRVFPAPFFIIGFYELIKRKNYLFLFLSIILLLGMFYNYRVAQFLPIFLLFGLTQFFETASKKVKILLILLSLASFGFNFYTYEWGIIKNVLGIC